MKRTSVITIVVSVVVIIAVLRLVVFVPAPSQSRLGSQTTAQGDHLTIANDELLVGFQSGLWNMTMVNSGTDGITKLTAVLATPVRTEVCSGFLPGVTFKNCPAVNGNAIPPGTKIESYATGAGPGSATIGDSYNITIDATFSDGQQYNFTSSITAQTA
jgi:hypothetical protein